MKRQRQQGEGKGGAIVQSVRRNVGQQVAGATVGETEQQPDDEEDRRDRKQGRPAAQML